MTGQSRHHVFDLGGTTIAGIYQQSVSKGLQTVRPLTDGSVRPKKGAVLQQIDSFGGGTHDIGALLGVTDVEGVADTDIIVFEKAVDRLGAPTAGSTHVKRTMALALIVPRTLSVGATDLATITFDCIGYSSSGGAGETAAGSQALADADSVGTGDLYGLGEVTYNGTTIEDVTSLSIDFGISVEALFSEGDVGAKLQTVDGVMPVVQFTTLDAALAATIGSGLALNGTAGLSIVLRRRSETGYVSAGTGAHVTIDIPDGTIYPVTSGGRRIEGVYRVEPLEDSGGGVSITAAVDQTYS